MVRQVIGAVQHYAWGDPTALPALLGRPADGTPWAEWWLGTHPGAPASLADGTPLHDVAGELPYLVKVLAAAEPLSLQTHPDRATAAAGYEGEERRGVPRDAPDRVFRDPYAKPEVVCALGPFEALCGFRPIAETLHLLTELQLTTVTDLLATHGVAGTVAALLERRVDAGPLVTTCSRSSHPTARVVVELDRRWPGDPAAVVAALLNHIVLARGEALHLEPGNLHAYLRGTAVEVMGPSDNVVRGGLTSKHVDVSTLLSIVDFAPVADPIVRAVEERPGRWRYPTAGTPFELWRWEIVAPDRHVATGREILVCTSGRCGELSGGTAAFLAPGETIELDGPATIHRVVETF